MAVGVCHTLHRVLIVTASVCICLFAMQLTTPQKFGQSFSLISQAAIILSAQLKKLDAEISLLKQQEQELMKTR